MTAAVVPPDRKGGGAGANPNANANVNNAAAAVEAAARGGRGGREYVPNIIGNSLAVAGGSLVTASLTDACAFGVFCVRLSACPSVR